MMQFSFLSLLGEVINSYFDASIMGRARRNGLISIENYNFLDFANKNKKIDKALLGGGAGQLLCYDVIYNAISHIKNTSTTLPKVIFLTPVAKQFNANDARRLSTYDHILFVCSRYEGFDERAVETLADEVYSVGDFILTGGELPALCLADSIARFVPNTLGNSASLLNESFDQKLLEAPNFSKLINNKKTFDNLHTISEYSKGNHTKISNLKLKLSEFKTRYFRPDLYKDYQTFYKNHKR